MEENKIYTLAELKDKKIMTIPEWMRTMVDIDEHALLSCLSFKLQFISWKKYIEYQPCYSRLLSDLNVFNKKSVLVLNRTCKAEDNASEVLHYMDDAVDEDGYIEDDYTMSDEELCKKYGDEDYISILLCIHDDLWQLDTKLATLLEKPDIRYQSLLPQIKIYKRRVEGYKNILLKYADKINIYRGYIHVNNDYNDMDINSYNDDYDEPDSKGYELDYYASSSIFISPYYCSNKLANIINKELEASDSLFDLM